MRSLVLLLLVSAACALDASEALNRGAGAEGGEGEGEEGEGEADGGEDTTGGGSSLTAGAWDDNLNFDVFSSFFSAQQGQLAGVPRLTTEEQHAAHERFAARAAQARLDVALVVDVTGSMGDELSYLQGELSGIAARIDEAHPDAEVRWALLSYQDEGDTYVTEVRDFTTLAGVQAALEDTSLGGGGDYPEAVEAALENTVSLDWRSDADVARLAFWIADAPHHVEDEERVTAALRDAAALDVHLYPVAASGIDALAEVTMRAGAQLTGGRYLFLTDDSGIGGEHAEPTIPCYFVTTLAIALERMIEIEMTGVWREPAAADVIRTGGDPQDGRCTLADGQEVVIF